MKSGVGITIRCREVSRKGSYLIRDGTSIRNMKKKGWYVFEKDEGGVGKKDSFFLIRREV